MLLKPGKLDAKESEIMREHCERGYEMVRKIPFCERRRDRAMRTRRASTARGIRGGCEAKRFRWGREFLRLRTRWTR